MDNILLLFNFGTGEIIIIVLVILLLFGGKKIPELMKGLGKGVRSFKEGMDEVKSEINSTAKDTKDEKKEE
ncbi:MAG: twin-arginine translocase TatA/TatE family subunit [Muribaculaceae bacterium]